MLLKNHPSYVSPRQRAQRTLELLNVAHPNQLPWPPHGKPYCENPPCGAEIQVTNDIREWDYGDYEGMTSPAIRALRKQQGLDADASWDIWRDGCPGGE
jgi:sedoheptulose-bisphosphatase